ATPWRFVQHWPVISCVLGIATSFGHHDVSSCHMQRSSPGGLTVPQLNKILIFW
ncbi:unnamed protein product, partial [Closterium sp. Yama58-4]